jgi:hypothetical protein
MAAITKTAGIICQSPRTTRLAKSRSHRLAHPTPSIRRLERRLKFARVFKPTNTPLVAFCAGIAGFTQNLEHVLCPFHRICARCAGYARFDPQNWITHTPNLTLFFKPGTSGTSGTSPMNAAFLACQVCSKPGTTWHRGIFLNSSGISCRVQ